jgi:hypothetical protein
LMPECVVAGKHTQYTALGFGVLLRPGGRNAYLYYCSVTRGAREVLGR